LTPVDNVFLPFSLEYTDAGSYVFSSRPAGDTEQEGWKMTTENKYKSEVEFRLAGISAGRVLDVATGRGQNIAAIAESFGDYTEIIGIDNVSASIEAARDATSLKGVSFLEMDAAKMTFEDASFDTICISNSMHHMVEPEAVLAESWRVLKPGGLLVVSEMICDNQTDTQMTHVLLHHWWGDIDRLRGICHNPTYSRAELTRLVETVKPSSLEAYDYVDPTMDAFDPEIRDQINGIIDDYLEKIPEGAQRDSLVEQGEALRERLKTVGMTWATGLIFLGWK
jgi:ubiquinone/menaquinone biosynthesis C-methylase UbiE